MAETLSEVLRARLGGGWVQCCCCDAWRDADGHAKHQAEGVRRWLLGCRPHITETLLTERMDGDYLVGAGRTIGNEGGDVALSQARAAEVAWWAADGVLGVLAGADQ